MKLFIIPSWYPTALHPESGSFFAERARLFQAAGHDVTVLSVNLHSLRDFFSFWKSGRPQSNFMKESGLEVYRYEAVNRWPGFAKRFYSDYRRHLVNLWNQAIAERGKPDAVIFNSILWSGSALAPTLVQDEIPYLSSEHLKEFILPDRFTPFQQNLINRTYKNAGKIIATSRALKEGIIRKFPDSSGKIALIANPVDTELFRPADAVVDTDSVFTFTAVALLRREKRIDLILRALAQLIDQQINVRLIITGDGPERKRLEKLVSSLKLDQFVEMAGYCQPPEVQRYLQQSNALVLASDVETFGVAAIEAMACGLPVVSTRSGGPEDIITAETGILVGSGDSGKLAVGMKKMIDDYGCFDKSLIRNYTVKNFGPAAFIRKYEKVLSNL